MTGSVLYRGASDKDLDLIIYPHNSTGEVWLDKPALKQRIREYFSAVEIHDCGGVSQVRDAKDVAWLQTPDGKRIDFFFLT